MVERHDRVGGYAHAFRRGSYQFDSAIHMVGGCRPSSFAGGGTIGQLLQATGRADALDFVSLDPLYVAQFGEKRFVIPAGIEAFVQAHVDAFPAEEKGLRQLLQDCLDIREEIHRAERGEASFGGEAADPFPTLRRWRRASLGRVLADRLGSAEARAVFATLWPYLGLPPERLSFLYWSTMLLSYVADGASYCRGTFQRLAEELALAVTETGGEVLLRSSVRRIRVESGRVAGVILENGQRIDAPLVVSGVDARQTVEELVGGERFADRYRARLARLEPSISAFLVYGASDLDLPELGLAHETFLYPDTDHAASYASSVAGRPDWLSLTVPTQADPALAPPGEHLFVITTLVSYAPGRDWRADKDAMTEHLLGLIERRWPGFREVVRFTEAATPRTLERYTRNTDGALYGFALSPGQVGPARPDPRTPVPGLYLAGHWSQPGGGVTGAARSGIEAACRALGLADPDALWRELGG